MKHVNAIGDLVQYGINPLTGEACTYSMRILCDLSAEGAALVANYFGLPHCEGMVIFNKNWNSMVGDKPAVASVMLARDCFATLARFAMFNVDQCEYVVVSKAGDITGFSHTDDYGPKYLELVQNSPDGIYTLYRNYNKGSTTGRNQHAFTGRTE
jgi:hypothetical protein